MDTFETELQPIAGQLLPRLQEAWRTQGAGDFDARIGYVQWAGFPEGLQIECVSNQFLGSGEQLTFEQRRTLAMEGWCSPDDEVPNYYLRYEDEQDLGFAAAALALAVIHVLGGPRTAPSSPAAHYSVRDLVSAVLDARLTVGAHDEYAQWCGDRAGAMIRAFSTFKDDLRFLLQPGQNLESGLDDLFDSAERSWRAMTSPFAGYLEAPREIVVLYEQFGEELRDAAEAARAKVFELLVAIVLKEGGLKQDATVTDDDLCRVGWEPTPDPRPDDDWW